MADVKFTLRIDRDLMDALAEQANKDRRSVNQQINLLIIRYLAELERNTGDHEQAPST